MSEPRLSRLAATYVLLNVPMWARGRWYVALCRTLMQRWTREGA